MGKRIFLIEDDANFLAGIKAQLSIDGHFVNSYDGVGQIENVMDELMQVVPDYIILGLILFNIDSFQLLSAIKQNQEHLQASVFIFSGFSDVYTKTRCQNLGADYYFIKTELNIEESANKVKKIIANREKLLLPK